MRIQFTAYEIEHDGDLAYTREIIASIGGRVVSVDDADFEHEESARLTIEMPEGTTLASFREAYDAAGGC